MVLKAVSAIGGMRHSIGAELRPRLPSAIDRQSEHVRPGVVAGRIEVLPLLEHPPVIQLRGDQVLAIRHRLDHPTSIRAGDAGAAIADDFVLFQGHAIAVRHAGGLFVGETSLEALGDYAAGPSHVMPTGGTARFSSALNVRDFQRVLPLIGLSQAGVDAIGVAAARLARAEGLEAHAQAIEARLRPAAGEDR